MKKKIISLLLCVAMTSAMIVGCGSSDTAATSSADSAAPAATTEASADDSAAPAAGGTITIMASQDWIEDSEQELGAKFEEETGIHVDYQILPAD